MDVVQEMRRRAFAAGRVFTSHKKLIDGLKNYGNPWLQPRSAREKWAKELGKKKIKIKNLNKEKVKVLYYVGCTAGVDPNMKKIAIATSKVLASAGVDFGILGNEETCCGSIYRRIGDEVNFKDLAQINIKRFNELYDAGVETIVTACAGCYRSIHEEYPEYADDFGEVKPRVLHVVEFVNELVKDKKFDMRKEQNIHVTYHDPCHIGRHCGLYEPPREVIKAIPGVEFTEMPRNRDFSFCCGAGGGFRTQYFDVALETAVKRVKEAEETGADYMLSTCPFCYQNLSLGIQESNSHLQFSDVTEVLAEVV
jgi:heterodisulfide reductase subunit D